MKKSEEMLYARIATEVCKYFHSVKMPLARLVEMFWDTAHFRSGFDVKYSDDEGRGGIFALPKPIFEEMKRRLGFGKKVSPLDPFANIEAAVAYVAWLFEKYEEFAPDEYERIKIAFFAIDAGYFSVKFALEKCKKPVYFEQILAVVNSCSG